MTFQISVGYFNQLGYGTLVVDKVLRIGADPGLVEGL